MRSQVDAMTDLGSWPLWPYLPVRRPTWNGSSQLGFLYATGAPVVYLENLFTYTKYPVAMDSLEVAVYDSAEDLVADGWRID
jgi:hypothetical protein